MAVALLIPAFEPGNGLVADLEALSRASRFEVILLVNDGSSARFESVFAAAALLDGVRVITHNRNRGKGAALKTGFRCALEHFPHLAGIVTADADGQHLPEDILRIAERLEHSPGTLILGGRVFDSDAVPWRSRFGNNVTRTLVRLLLKMELADTQTGLRGVPRSLLPALLELQGDRYEFELEMLVAAKHAGLRFEQLPIRTVYETGNPSSHFRWLVDSVKISAVLVRASAAGLRREHLAMLVLLASAVFAARALISGGIFSQVIWFPEGRHRVELFLAVFAVAAVPPLFLLAGRFFRLFIVAAVLALTWFAVGPIAPAAVVLFALSVTVLGSRILAADETADGTLLLAFAAGAAVLISAEEILVRLPWNYRWSYILLLAIPVAVWPARSARVLRSAWAGIRPSGFHSLSERLAAGTLTLLLLAHWLLALKPEVSEDGLSMHLAIADGIAFKHRFAFDLRHHIWAVMPMGGDWCFTITQVIGGEFATRLLNWAFLLVLTGLIFAACRRFLARDRALWIAALFAATPIVEAVTGSTMIENIQAAMLLGAVTALWNFRDTGRVRYVYAAALCFGTALHVKFGSMAFAIPGLVLLGDQMRRKWKLLGLRPALVCIGAAAVVIAAGAPPYIIAAARTGNPLYPFANGLFHSRLLPEGITVAEHRFREPLRARTPYDLTFRTSRFYEGEDGSMGMQYWLLVPASLMLLRGRVYEPWSAAVIALMGSLAVIFTQPNARYLYPAFPLLHVTLATLLAGAPAMSALYRAVAYSLVACALGLNALLFPIGGWYHKGFYSAPVFTQAGRELYLRDQEPRRLLIAGLNREHAGETVFLPENSHIEGIHAPVFRNHWHDWQTKQALDGAHDLDEVLELLRRWGVERFLMPAQAEGIPFRVIRELASHCIDVDERAGDSLSGHLNARCRERMLAPRSLPADGGTIYDDRDARLLYSGDWTHAGQFFRAHGDTVSYSNARGASVRFAFTGPEVTWVYTAAPNRGIAKVFVDGRLKKSVDLFSSEARWLSVARFNGLPPGAHVIEVTVTGTKRPDSADTYVDVDAFRAPGQ